jgi:hypothetical protein
MYPKISTKRGYEMNSWRFFLPGILLLTLCACAAQQGDVKTSPAGTSKTPSAATSEMSSPGDKAAPSIEVPALPCAEVVRTEGVTIRYGAEKIYRGGSVLPRQEGLVCLEALTDWLKSVPQSRWQVTSAGEAEVGFDPQALAGKRQELLQRFFARQGIEAQTDEWQAIAGQGPQLQLQLVAN